MRLCQNWWNAQDIVREYSVDEIGESNGSSGTGCYIFFKVLGMASQIAEEEDHIVVEDLRGA